MKRRNAECGKLRRPLKRSKITEGIYGSTFLYVKFLMVWALVLMADFILEFRFEYLWPFWLLVRSVYDSFKFQGLAFSVFFVCVAITSDVICYLFIPVQWLFFAASTYVWVQYVWHTERGICLPTVFLWLLFVYIEASVRLREFKSLPFHLDLCRPFAAHCIGYPVVTLGFGFKSYISYRIRVRKQKDVQKENGFYTQLLQQALPSDQQSNTEKQKGKDPPDSPPHNNHQQPEFLSQLGGRLMHWPVLRLLGVFISMSGTFIGSQSSTSLPSKAQDEISNGITPPVAASNKKQASSKTTESPATGGGGGGSGDVKDTNKHKSSSHIEDCQYIEQNVHTRQQAAHNINDYDEENYKNDQHAKTFKTNGVNASKTTNKLNSSRDVSSSSSSKKSKSNNANKESPASTTASTPTTTANSSPFTNNKEESIARLESDIKRLKADLQSTRNSEQELRSQITNLMVGEKSMKSEVYQLRQDNESLQTKLHNLVTSRQQDKQNLAVLERKLAEERKTRSLTEQQLSQERKAKKSEEAARVAALANRVECTEACKSRRRELENEIKHIRHEIHLREDQVRQFERETQSLRQYKDVQNEKEILMSALAAVQDKNSHLENSLSSVTRLKLDLFSALGDAKRQIEIQAGLLVQKDQEITELKQKVAEVMALMPATAASYTPTSSSSSPHFSSKFTNNPVVVPHDEDVLAKSSLNPNASDYTPKCSSP